jgi:hypothetical protein
MLGIGDYANTSRLMNDNIRAFKGLSSQVASENIKLAQQAREAADLDDLRNIGQEFAIKGGKDLLEKYGTRMYKGKVPFNDFSIQDLDKAAGNIVADGLDRFVNLGSNVPPPLSNGETATARNFTNRLNFGSNDIFEEHGGFGDLGQIDTLQENATFNDVINEKRSRITPVDELVESPQREMPMKTAESNVEMAQLGEPAEALGEEVGEAAGEAVSDVAGEIGGEALGETVAQGVGVALDSTGILAPLGGLISLGADIFALFEAGKSAVDVVQRDITKTKPQPTGPQIDMPTQPLTLAQKGYGVTPSLDTFDVQHNTVSSRW